MLWVPLAPWFGVFYSLWMMRMMSVGAQLEKGAPPPFDPPNLVPHFAWPNPELALLAQHCFAYKKIAKSCSDQLPRSSTGLCLPLKPLMLLRGAPQHYAFRQAGPLDTQNLPNCQNLPLREAPSPICPNQPTWGALGPICPYWPPGGAPGSI